MLVDQMAFGRPGAHVANELGRSRQCTYRWAHRYRDAGRERLRDLSSRPLHSLF
ncbi:hypothetical protein B5P43_35345 [Bacillus sp. SRB_336]|nr:hypothetical protein B5P43_35345 [Bacillus sp. SRB_336]